MLFFSKPKRLFCCQENDGPATNAAKILGGLFLEGGSSISIVGVLLYTLSENKAGYDHGPTQAGIGTAMIIAGVLALAISLCAYIVACCRMCIAAVAEERTAVVRSNYNYGTANL